MDVGTTLSDLELITHPMEYAPTLSKQVLYCSDEIREAANAFTHKLRGHQDDTVRQKSNAFNVNSKKNGNSAASVVHDKECCVLNPSIAALYSLEELKKVANELSQNRIRDVDSVTEHSEFPSAIQIKEKLKTEQQGTPSTAVLYSERELAEQMKTNNIFKDTHELSAANGNDGRNCFIQESGFPSITSDSDASPSLTVLYSETELAHITKKIKRRIFRSKPRTSFIETHENVIKKEDIPKTKSVRATVKNVEISTSSDLTLSELEEYDANVRSQPPRLVEDNIAVLYSKKEINEKMKKENMAYFDPQCECRNEMEIRSASVAVMFSETEIQDTRRKFETVSSTTPSEFFCFGTVSNVPSLSFFMEETMKIKVSSAFYLLVFLHFAIQTSLGNIVRLIF